MALSYYYNRDACQQFSSDAHTQTNVQLMYWELQDFSHNLDLPDNSFNSVFDPNNLFYSSENYNFPVPHFLTPTSDDLNLSNCASITQAPAVPFQEFDPLMYCPKRQKAACIDYEVIYPRAIYSLQDYNSQEVVIPPLPVFPCGPPVYSGGIRCESSTKKSLSAKSISARQRRRKITDKSQELGKLIPGGHKMNTAEMIHAAYKYIKFL
ncbi:transcription factor IND-like [Primulina huaijiensis]|uniref:transcription factor IND-like n=1 Tax=Primulina huaijiensis TaxID=1492673 RepID=UPI003CC6E3FB